MEQHQKDTSTPTLNEVDDNATTTSTKDCLSTVQNDVIHTNDITTNTTTDNSTLAIGTSNILERTNSVSLGNEFLDFLDEGTATDCSAVNDKDSDYIDGNESDRASSIGTSQSRKSKEIAIEQIKDSLLPPMPALLDDVEPSQEPVETQLNDTSQAGTPESISFNNDNDELSIESFRNNSCTYSQTSHTSSEYIKPKIENLDDIVTVFNLAKSTKSDLPSQR